jgi:hypothetical protein
VRYEVDRNGSLKFDSDKLQLSQIAIYCTLSSSCTFLGSHTTWKWIVQSAPRITRTCVVVNRELQSLKIKKF